MNSGFNDHDQWFTSVRAIAFEATTAPTPEIRGLARVDFGVGVDGCARFEVASRRFATIADETTRKLTVCTPATVAQTIWAPHPPDAIAVYGAATWDWFPPLVTRGIARIDMAKVARVVWPGAPSFDLVPLINWVRTDYAGQVPPASGHLRLAWVAEAIANLTMAAAMVAGESTIRHAERLGQPAGSSLDDAFEGMRSDPRLQAFVTISATPTAPAKSLPGPWDDEHEWFGVAAEDLSWVVASATATDCMREAAAAELARRAARDAALLMPRMLLRRAHWR